MIPNAGVCALSLYYGKGDFARTIEIATMCGWDTDCNAGNVGAIIGVMNGPEDIPVHYRTPMNDFHAASSISGSLNIIDLPTAAKELAILGLEQLKESVPEEWKKGTFSDDIFLDFSLPGSTSGIRTSSEYLAPIAPGEEFFREGCVSVLLDRLVRGKTARLFYKPFYRREDFDDERYSPTFTPLVYSGQTLRIRGEAVRLSGQRIAVAPYVRDSSGKEIFNDSYIFPTSEEEFEFNWTIPEVPFAIDEVGLLVTNFDSEKFLGNLFVKEMEIKGKKSFSVQFKEEQREFRGLSRCSCVGGAWDLEFDGLHVLTQENFYLCSGPYYQRDCAVTTRLIPQNGESHMVMARSGGAETGYFFGMYGQNKVALFKRDHDLAMLAEADFPWDAGKEYSLSLEARENNLTCRIDGRELIAFADDNPLLSGMAGTAMLKGGRTLFLDLTCREL